MVRGVRKSVRAKNKNHRVTGLPQRDGSTGRLLGILRGSPSHTHSIILSPLRGLLMPWAPCSCLGHLHVPSVHSAPARRPPFCSWNRKHTVCHHFCTQDPPLGWFLLQIFTGLPASLPLRCLQRLLREAFPNT